MNLKKINDLTCPVKSGFTLAETLIVLAILGVVAALTVPTLVRRQSEAANRTKIKKAMRTYDAAIQQMAVVNNLRSDSALVAWADSADKNNCANTSSYFKVVSGAGCQFRTSDGLWWDISDIKKPIVAFEQADLTEDAANGNDNKAFYFVTSFDPKARAFRTNDAQYEIANNGASDEMKKLFAFVGMLKQAPSFSEKVNEMALKRGYCSCQGANCCTASCSGNRCYEMDPDAKCRTVSTSNTEYTPSNNCTRIDVYGTTGNLFGSAYVDEDNDMLVFDKNGYDTTITKKVNPDGSYTLYKKFDSPYEGNAINGITYDKNGKVVSYYNYNRGTCTRTSCTWSPNPFDNDIQFSHSVKGTDESSASQSWGADIMYDLMMDRWVNNK